MNVFSTVGSIYLTFIYKIVYAYVCMGVCHDFGGSAGRRVMLCGRATLGV